MLTSEMVEDQMLAMNLEELKFLRMAVDKRIKLFEQANSVEENNPEKQLARAKNKLYYETEEKIRKHKKSKNYSKARQDEMVAEYVEKMKELESGTEIEETEEETVEQEETVEDILDSALNMSLETPETRQVEEIEQPVDLAKAESKVKALRKAKKVKKGGKRRRRA